MENLVSRDINFVISPSGWRIIDTFFERSVNKSVYQISVQELCSTLQINRKTFYQNFANREDLISWIFAYQLHTYLTEHESKETLTFERDAKDRKYLQLAIYRREIFLDIKRVLLEHAPYYKNVMASLDKEPLSAYLYKVYTPLIHQELRGAERIRKLGKNEGHFAAQFISKSLINLVLKDFDTVPDIYFKHLETKLISAFIKK